MCTVVRAVCALRTVDRIGNSDRACASKRRTHNYSKKRKKYTAKMRHKHGHNHKLHVLPIPHAERESAELDSGNGRGNLTPPLTPLSQHCGFDSPDLLGRVGLESVRSYRHCHLSCRRRPVSPFGPSRACEHTLRCASLCRCVSARCACVRVCAAVYVFDRSAHLALPLLALVVSLEWSAACTECGM